MLPPTTDYKQIQSLIAGGQTILIVLPNQADIDALSAGLGLYLSLIKMGKDALILANKKTTVAEARLVGIDKIKTSLSGRNLVISLDYQEDAIDKVSYNVDNNKFNLIIQPKPAALPLDANKVSFSYSGADAQLIFLVGVADLSSLGKAFENNQSLLAQRDIIYINNQSPANLPANVKVSLIDSQANSLSELIVKMLKLTRSNLDVDIANNLLVGIRQATNNLQNSQTGPLALEAAAVCLRSGAKLENQVKATKTIVERQVFSPPLSPSVPAATVTPATNNSQNNQDGEKVPPPDWLKPKIYHSSQDSKR